MSGTVVRFILCSLLSTILAPSRGSAQQVAVAPFAVDVTPPIGSPLCDGLVLPARKIVDRLTARGIVIFGRGKPIVLCAVDWVGIGNEGHKRWRRALSAAAGTTADRVCVHALHPHDAPGCDFAAEKLLAAHGLAGKMFPVEFARAAIDRAAAAVREAVKNKRRVTHYAIGKARVDRVASNRRILGSDGQVEHVRYSKCVDPEVRALPEGLVDPFVRILSFLDGETPVATLSYYATHPQSYYGSGGVSCDFVGLARNSCDTSLDAGHWVHFNGAGGNITAGKYNDGEPQRRNELARRLAEGMRRAWASRTRYPIGRSGVSLRTVEVRLPAAPALYETKLLAELGDATGTVRERIRAARDLAWWRRCKAKDTITLACLTVGRARVLHLPGESFVEYQLFAAALHQDLHVCTAAYGDYGPGYIGTEIAYSQGGYETGRVSRVAPSVETELRRGIRNLLDEPGTPFLAGAASVKITPLKAVRLSGYAARTRPSSGVLQDIHAKALALTDADGNRAVLITADLIGITRKLADDICGRLREALHMPRSAIMIATSHTHTAPALSDHLVPMFEFAEGEKQRVDQYTEFVANRCVEVAKKAFDRLAPARLSWGVGECGFAVNRRNNREADVPELRKAGRLAGPVDHSVPVLRVESAKGKLRAVVFGYACHCTVLGFRKISGDYAGFAQSKIEGRHPGAVALFVTGCGGDQNPLPRHEIALAQRYGEQLANRVEMVLDAKMTPLRGPLHTALRLTALDFDRLPTQEELEADLDHANVYQRRRARLLLDRIKRDGKLASDYDYPVQAWRLGDELTWIALGGEATVEYSLGIKRIYGATRTWVASNCNDVMAYIPSSKVWKEGGYEGGGAMVYYGQPSRWAASVENKVMEAVRETVAKTVAHELPRTPPKPPRKSKHVFEVAPGKKVKLVAAEPLVADPVDMEFDERGDLWVVEMRDYPFDERDGQRPAGRVRVLRDKDGDGRMDESRVFADGLSWPTAIALWKGGAFVAAAPDIYYLKDTSGDGRANHREVVFSGFGRDNVQTLANNMVLQPDGWFYGAGGGDGGKVVSRRKPGIAPVHLRGRDFRFHPDGRFESMTGGGQFGHTIDDYGRRFVCNNSDHARHVVLESRYVECNPLLAPPKRLASIAAEGGSGPVFRLSPPEPWRVVRTRLRVGGHVRGPIEHGGAATGYFTSATGITVYRGTALPGCNGDLIVGDVASNLVHHKKVAPCGATFRAKRAETGGELLASPDIWFRPTNFANGPDGALYVCDMYREIVEHPWSLPDEIKPNLDLLSGNDRGRIWRITGDRAPPYRKPDLRAATTADLVGALDHPDGWWRDTAMRLLLERRGAATVRELKSRLAGRMTAPGVALALRLLRTFDALDEATHTAGLHHRHPGVREVAVRLWVPPARASAAALQPLLRDPSARVRFQLACTLGSFAGSDSALAALAIRDGGDPWTRAAILGAAKGLTARRLLAALTSQADVAKPLVFELCSMLGASRDAADQAAVSGFLKSGHPRIATALLGLAAGMRRRGADVTSWVSANADAIPGVFDRSSKTMLDAEAPVGERVGAARAFGLKGLRECGAKLLELMSPRQPPALQSAAIEVVAAHSDARAAELLLADWESRPPALRALILDAVLTRRAHVEVLLARLRDRSISPTALSATHTARLRGHPVAAVRSRARALLGSGAAPRRAEVIARYRPALAQPGDVARGRKVFEATCITCHRHGGRGTAIGPDLETVRERTPAALLEQILDPGREVDPAYLLYVAGTTDGRTFAGSILRETATAVTLQLADGKQAVLARDRIESLQTSGLSLMPEGLEATITPAAMADLIAFLRHRE